MERRDAFGEPLVGLTRPYHDWLMSCCLSPSLGMRQLADCLARDFGCDVTEQPPELLNDLEMAIYEAMRDAARDVLKEHGIQPCWE